MHQDTIAAIVRRLTARCGRAMFLTHYSQCGQDAGMHLLRLFTDWEEEDIAAAEEERRMRGIGLDIAAKDACDDLQRILLHMQEDILQLEDILQQTCEEKGRFSDLKSLIPEERRMLRQVRLLLQSLEDAP